ncbi:hypothetical protein GCM10027076_32410 [Nocardioides montaniterrae]
MGQRPLGSDIVRTRVVVAGTGRVVAGAKVRIRGITRSTDAAGEVDLSSDSPTLASISADGYLPRVVAMAPDAETTVELTPRRRNSLSIRFAGDTMMGRRFYTGAAGSSSNDGANDGTNLASGPDQGPLLHVGDGVAPHARVLQQIAPLLGDADVTAVNLETPLLATPYVPGKRPPGVSKDKTLAFASSTSLADALAQSGVDVVSLSNNHVYDAGEAGLRSTIKALDAAGVVHYGAGSTVEQAWRPAYVDVGKQTVAFIGCTTVAGDQYVQHYVAGPTQGGAARCDKGRLKRALKDATRKADVVVFELHGGVEYVRKQTRLTDLYNTIAAHAGASVIVDGHPHVVGGITHIGHVPVLESYGNLVFDQDLWEPLLSYSMRVDLDGGKPVHTTLDPFAIENYRPVPVVGGPADAAARIAGDIAKPDVRLGDGGALAPTGRPVTTSLSGKAGEVAGLPVGSEISTLPAGMRAGTDLLWGTGSMEDLDTDPDSGTGLLWALGMFAEVKDDSACHGTWGLRLQRSPVSRKDVVSAPLHRIAVVPGSQLSFVADIKHASAGAVLELHWYGSSAGSSLDALRYPIPQKSIHSGCTTFRVDVKVPKKILYVQPWLRVHPPHDIIYSRELMIDDLKLVQWEKPGVAMNRDDVVDFGHGGTVALSEPAHATR